jgi:hypothetical protein
MPWQRCQFPLQQNTQANMSHMEMLAEVGNDVRAIFTAPD